MVERLKEDSILLALGMSQDEFTEKIASQEDANDIIREMVLKFHNTLCDIWLDNGAEEINKSIRNGYINEDGTVDLPKFMRESPLAKKRNVKELFNYPVNLMENLKYMERVLFRRVVNHDCITVYRGISIDFDEYEEGDIFESKTYTSTSIDETVAADFGETVMKITIPPNNLCVYASVLSIFDSNAGHEDEIILFPALLQYCGTDEHDHHCFTVLNTHPFFIENEEYYA